MELFTKPRMICLLALLLSAVACGEKKTEEPLTTTKEKPPVKSAPATPALDLDTPLRVVGRIRQVSAVPAPETLDYDDLLTTVKVDVETVEKGTYDKKAILVQLLAIRDKALLPAAGLKVGDRVAFYLVPWAKTLESIKSLQQVDDVADYELPPFFAAAHVRLSPGPDAKKGAAAAAARKKAIDETRAALEAELQKYGSGSYDKWLESLSGFYEDMKRQGEAITHETARKGEFGPFKKHNLSVYKSLHQELVSVPADEHPALPQIVDFAKALKERGIDLIYLSIPRPQLVYPDYITDVELPHLMVAPRYREQLKTLVDHDVEVIDTVPFIMAHREGAFGRMYRLGSLHPTNAYMRRFAEMAAARIGRYGLTEDRFTVLVDKAVAPDHDTEVRRVLFPDGTPYTDAERSPLMVIGDSTIRLNWPSPNTGFSGHLSRLTGVRAKMVQRNSFGLAALTKEAADLFDGVEVVVWVQWSLFIGKPLAVPGWWKTPIDWSKTRVLGRR